MCSDPHERISVEEARSRVLTHLSSHRICRKPLGDALGYVLAEDIRSDIDVNPFDNSSMDGYALISSDCIDASPSCPVLLDVVGYIGAGSVFDGKLFPGQAVRLMTGAPLPEGADCVQKYEEVTIVAGDGGTGSTISLAAPLKPGTFVRKAGEEFKAGDIALKSSTVLDAYALGMAASAGAQNVTVYARPVVGIFAIGSELVPAFAKPSRGQIRDSNSYTLDGLARRCGAETKLYGIVPDDMQAINETLHAALSECDIVVSAGGASQGDFDFIQSVIEEQGELIFSFLSLRPGKRQSFGIIDSKMVFGLSGNPAAASVGFELLIRPAIRSLLGFRALERPRVRATLIQPITKKENRVYYDRGRVEQDTGGRWVAYDQGTQNSALLGDLERCNCLIIVPEESTGMNIGDQVTCLRLDLDEGVDVPQTNS